nr:GTP-binding protein [uncultured Cellulosilyticum sp.]
MEENIKVKQIIQEEKIAALKDVLKIVVVGHVDHGKSTLIGRLLYDTNSLPEGAIDKVKRIAKETGKPFEYAYLLDAFEEEQKQGITIDTTQLQFRTQQREYVIIDAPGHKEFLKNMISGAANAEAALLMVDAKEGVQEQSKRHAYMLSLLGIKKVYVIVNKMDLVDYRQDVFKKIKSEMGAFLTALNVHPLDYLPVSAFEGENIARHSDEMPWYKGPSIIEAIDLIKHEEGLNQKPLRFPIQDVYKFDDRRIIAGRIESGTLKVGDEISIYPEGKTTRVKAFAYWVEKDKREVGYAGESIGIIVEDEFFNKRGEIITHKEHAPIVTTSFRASLFWMGKQPLEVGKKYKLKLATEEVEVIISEIVKMIDATNLNQQAETSKQIAMNGVAEVIVEAKEPVVIDLFGDSQVTGRFVLVDGYDVVGGGIVTSAENAKSKSLGLFKAGNLEGRTDLFDEFYYNTVDYELEKVPAAVKEYGIGDTLPLEGDSYTYPKDFDLLILRDQVAVYVREGKVAQVKDIKVYNYEGYPVINGRGFGIKVTSETEVLILLSDYQKIKYNETEVSFSEKWLDIQKYRKLAWRKENVV